MLRTPISCPARRDILATTGGFYELRVLQRPVRTADMRYLLLLDNPIPTA